METDTATQQEQEAPENTTEQQEEAPQQDAQQEAEQQEKPEGAEYTPEEVSITEKAQALLNQRGTKYTIGYDRVREYIAVVNGTENFLAGMTLAGMKRIATGEDRVPRTLTEKWSSVYGQLSRQHWHWLKGIIAVAVAMNYEPPKIQPEPPEETPVTEGEADAIAKEAVETDSTGEEKVDADKAEAVTASE